VLGPYDPCCQVLQVARCYQWFELLPKVQNSSGLEFRNDYLPPHVYFLVHQATDLSLQLVERS